MKKVSKKKLALDIITVVVIACITGAAAYINDYYHSRGVEDAISSSDTVKVTEIKEGYFFDGEGAEDALIFYPGGKVEYSAYAPLLHELAGQGIDCFLIKMPANLAVLGKDKAEHIIENYDYTHWYMAGHSLGGAMAAAYTEGHQEEISGLVLLGAYATEDISGADFPALIIYGSEDRIMNRENFEKYRSNLPKNTTIVELEGGNHSNFGNYGQQEGDGEASISPKEQQKLVVENIINTF
ncbi:MAG: alpha/beta hydrolase [Lachnospiraceae bacterium]|nr:alpha/beta hydrolase [Lachnospiraceae bacterium]